MFKHIVVGGIGTYILVQSSKKSAWFQILSEMAPWFHTNPENVLTLSHRRCVNFRWCSVVHIFEVRNPKPLEPFHSKLDLESDCFDDGPQCIKQTTLLHEINWTPTFKLPHKDAQIEAHEVSSLSQLMIILLYNLNCLKVYKNGK